MNDQIGSSHMIQGNLTSFIEDRFGCPNSALALNGGWTQVPSGIYFDSPEFTISVWVYPQQVGRYSRIIDFANGQNVDSIIFSLANENNPQDVLAVFQNSTIKINTKSSQNLTFYKWQFIVATFNGSNARLYLNGTLTAESNLSYTLPTLSRNSCFIGKSNWYEDGYSWSYLDDLRFYNKSLSKEEILELMNQNETSKIIFENYFFITLF